MVSTVFSSPSVERSAAAARDVVVGAVVASGLVVVTAEVGDVVEGGPDAVRVRVDVVSRTVEGVERTDVAWVAQVDGAAPANSAAVATPVGPMGVWWYPDDPELPGLRAAVTTGALSDLLGDDIDAADVEVVTYLPLHQAVVRVGVAGDADGSGRAAAFVRVVPPSATEHVVGMLERCRAAGVDVPDVVGTDRALGLVVTGALPGVTLRDRLVDGGPVPDAHRLWRLVRRVADVDIDRVCPVEALPLSVRRHAGRLAVAVPDLADRVEALGRRLAAFGVVPHPAVVHGDLHDRQLLVDASGAITGVLDVDDLGRGDVLDDLGRLVAHVVVRGCAGEVPDGRVDAVVVDWIEGLGAHVDADQLRHRAAVALLGLAHGPWRTGQPDAAETVRRTVSAAEALAPG